MAKQTLTHESSGVGLIGPDLSVDLDQSLLDNSSDFTAGKSVLETVTEEDGKGERLSELVRSGRWSRGLHVSRDILSISLSMLHVLARGVGNVTHVCTAEFVEHP